MRGGSVHHTTNMPTGYYGHGFVVNGKHVRLEVTLSEASDDGMSTNARVRRMCLKDDHGTHLCPADLGLDLRCFPELSRWAPEDRKCFEREGESLLLSEKNVGILFQALRAREEWSAKAFAVEGNASKIPEDYDDDGLSKNHCRSKKQKCAHVLSDTTGR